MSEQVSVNLRDGKVVQVLKGTTFMQLIEQLQVKHTSPIVCARVGNVLRELCSTIEEPLEEVSFVDLTEKDGMRIYQRTSTFLLIVAVQKCFPSTTVLVNHHIAGGYFCEFDKHLECTSEHLQVIEDYMHSLVEKELSIQKSTLSVDEALRQFKVLDMPDKEALFKYRRTSTVNLYELDGIKNYFHEIYEVFCFHLYYKDLEHVF